MNNTLDYYNNKAEDYAVDTQKVDFSELQNLFASRLKHGAHILDLGCGAGRDSKAFLERDYKVTSIDGSAKLAEIASKFIGQDVTCCSFQEYNPDGLFDGIWACASLLHLSLEDLKDFLIKIASHLDTNGYMYASFKYGTFSGERNGRFFTDMTEDTIKQLIDEVPLLKIDKLTISEDVRADRGNEKWLNVFIVRD